MRHQGRLGGSSPGHASAIGTEDSHWQGCFLTPGSPFSSGERAWPKIHRRPTIPRWDTNRLIALLKLPGFASFPLTREILIMPGKAAKITITERQQEILQTLRTPSRRRPGSGNAPPSSCWPLTASAMTRSPRRSAWPRRQSDSGGDAGPTPGTASSTSSAPRPAPSCAGPSSRPHR